MKANCVCTYIFYLAVYEHYKVILKFYNKYILLQIDLFPFSRLHVYVCVCVSVCEFSQCELVLEMTSLHLLPLTIKSQLNMRPVAYMHNKYYLKQGQSVPNRQARAKEHIFLC